MINWIASNISEELVKNKTKIVVTCELCGTNRPQLYQVAKRKPIHHCMSCVKSGNNPYKTGELVDYVCIDCSAVQNQKYRPERFVNWRCHHCAMVQGHKEGKFIVYRGGPSEDGKRKLSELAKKRWEDKEYREKWGKTRASTKEKRSIASKKFWSDTENLANLSAQIKKVWANPTYRTVKTKQSQEQWKNEEYIIKQLKGFDFESRNKISVSSLNNWALNRDKLTAIIINNLSKTEVRDKIKLKSLQNWQNPEYAKSVIDGLQETFKSPRLRQLLSKVSLEWWAIPENREFGEQHLADLRSKMPRISSIQIKLYEILDTFKIIYEKESDATIVGPYQFDCLIPKQNGIDKNLFIECQGDYWHALSRSMINDKRKFDFIDNYFDECKILYLWEHEFSDKELITNKLKAIFGQLPSIDFKFSDVKIKTIDYDASKKLFDNCHYLGVGGGGIAVGAFLNDELIGGVAYTSPLRQTTAPQFGLKSDEVLELSRFCIHPSYHKKNFASWLIAKSLKFIDCKLVISYADTTVGHKGTIYKASGFRLDHEVRPDYWYVSPSNWIMHKRTLYGKAVKAGMNERDYADSYGYIRKYGGPKLCFVKILSQK